MSRQTLRPDISPYNGRELGPQFFSTLIGANQVHLNMLMVDLSEVRVS